MKFCEISNIQLSCKYLPVGAEISPYSCDYLSIQFYESFETARPLPAGVDECVQHSIFQAF